jgi:glutathione S-transferase
MAPNPKLLPQDPVLKARVRACCEIVNSAMQPMQNISVQKKIKELGGNPKEWGHYWLTKGFDGNIK